MLNPYSTGTIFPPLTIFCGIGLVSEATRRKHLWQLKDPTYLQVADMAKSAGLGIRSLVFERIAHFLWAKEQNSDSLLEKRDGAKSENCQKYEFYRANRSFFESER